MPRPEADYIGFDPVKWIQRLRDVNADSQFPNEAKKLIEESLLNLQEKLL